MLTAGDIEFERPSAKFGRFGPSIVVMIAGDFSIQDEICQRTVHGKSAGFSSVSEAVSAYYAEVSSYNVRLAERSVLSPLGLNMESFIARQREFSPKFVDQVKYEIRTAQSQVDIATIITGMDEEGGHIYTVDSDGVPFCNDSIGFAAIGSGARHAQSQFMLNRYSANCDLAMSLVAIYAAKRRAEVAPGVGLETDIFMIRQGEPMIMACC